MTALFAALQILSNHVQMSYYFAFLIVFLLIGYFVEALRGKALRSFIIATCVTLFAGAIAIGINGSNLYHTYEYGQETNSKYRLPLRASTRNISPPGATARARPSRSSSPTSTVEHRVHSAKAQQIWRMYLPNSSRSSEV